MKDRKKERKKRIMKITPFSKLLPHSCRGQMYGIIVSSTAYPRKLSRTMQTDHVPLLICGGSDHHLQTLFHRTSASVFTSFFLRPCIFPYKGNSLGVYPKFWVISS